MPAGGHEAPHHALLGEAELLEDTSHRAVVERGRSLDPLGAELREEVRGEQRDRLRAVAAPADGLVEDGDPELEDAGRQRPRRLAGVDLADEPPIDLDRQVEPAALEAA